MIAVTGSLSDTRGVNKRKLALLAVKWQKWFYFTSMGAKRATGRR